MINAFVHLQNFIIIITIIISFTSRRKSEPNRMLKILHNIPFRKDSG
jgi:hypothetical protein